MNSLSFVKGDGGTGTPLAGSDHISGLLFYSGTLPSGFTSSDRIKVVYSVSDAETLGIVDTSTDETKSTATFVVSNAGAAGDIIKLTCAIIDSTNPLSAISSLGTVTLCNYTFVTGDSSSTTTAATAIKNAINALTYVHGFTATSSTATVTITAAPGQGVFLNSGTPYTATITQTGGLAGTLTQNVIAGVASEIDIMHYHISEYFRKQPKGKLYVGIYATSDATTFANVTTMQNYANGEMRQIGIYQKTTAFAASQCTTLQGVLTTLATNKRPLSAIYQAEFSTFTDVTNTTNYSNLHSLTAPNVSVTIGQDGAAKGYKLWKATAKSIGCVGACLGDVSYAGVHESISWYDKFNLSNGVEMEVLAFANGQYYTALSTGTITNLDAYGYLFGVKEIDFTGSFWNGSWTATATTSDYVTIERNRTIDKSIRGMRFYLTPALGSNTYSNADGTLTQGIISYFESLAQKALDQMTAAGELSQQKVTINANQNVVSTSKLVINVQEVPTGIARTIEVNVGYTTAITN
jgi:hypothetical protein